MLESGDRVGAGATLIDRGSYSGMDPDFVRRQTEGGHPFENVNVQIDPTRCHQLSVELDHLPSTRCEAGSNGGDAVVLNREITVAIEPGRRITNPPPGEYQIVGRFRSIHRHLGTLSVHRDYGAGYRRESQAQL
jgi:hypothetical protein